MSPRFCHVLKLQAPHCLHYNAVKPYQPDDSESVFTTSQKYIFNVHQITTSTGNFNIFPARTRTKTAQNAPKHAISSKKFDFWVPFPRLFPVGRDTLCPHPTPSPLHRQALWIRFYVSPEFHPGLRQWKWLCRWPIGYLCHGDVGRGDLFAAGVLNVDGDADVFAWNERSTVELQWAGHDTPLTRAPARHRFGVHSHTLLHTPGTPNVTPPPTLFLISRSDGLYMRQRLEFKIAVLQGAQQPDSTMCQPIVSSYSPSVIDIVSSDHQTTSCAILSARVHVLVIGHSPLQGSDFRTVCPHTSDSRIRIWHWTVSTANWKRIWLFEASALFIDAVYKFPYLLTYIDRRHRDSSRNPICDTHTNP